MEFLTVGAEAISDLFACLWSLSPLLGCLIQPSCDSMCLVLFIVAHYIPFGCCPWEACSCQKGGEGTCIWGQEKWRREIEGGGGGETAVWL